MEQDKPKGIIDGFDEDFSRISKDYSENHHDMKLTDFFLYWMNNKMDLMFVNRYDPRELLDAISEMNKLLVTKLNGENDIEWVVALYMLLCIYVKQPQRQRRSFRITMDEFISIDKLVSSKGSDPSFAWKCLKNSNAIHIGEEKAEYGPQLLKKGGNKNYNLSDGAVPDQEKILKDDAKAMIEKQTRLIEEFESIYGSYQEILASLDIENKTNYLNEVKETIRQLKGLVE